jgi:hypothetical protein
MHAKGGVANVILAFTVGLLDRVAASHLAQLMGSPTVQLCSQPVD